MDDQLSDNTVEKTDTKPAQHIQMAEALLGALDRGAGSNAGDYQPKDSRRDGVFGAVVRSLREDKGVGLRKFARQVGISAAYLSQIERNEAPPPAEERVIEISKALGQHTDVLIALTGRVSSILHQAIFRFPHEMSDLIRTTLTLSKGEIAQVGQFAKQLSEAGSALSGSAIETDLETEEK